MLAVIMFLMVFTDDKVSWSFVLLSHAVSTCQTKVKVLDHWKQILENRRKKVLQTLVPYLFFFILMMFL